jgi:hypothetical protein
MTSLSPTSATTPLSSKVAISHKLLYSVNALLAYRIANRLYKQRHYVWGSPHFSGNSVSKVVGTNPPTSLPVHIYKNLFAEASNGDLHSANIARIRSGLLKGVSAKHVDGTIDDATRLDLIDTISQAQTIDFKPLLFVIPATADVEAAASFVKLPHRASILSQEYLFPALHESLFDVIDLEGICS